MNVNALIEKLKTYSAIKKLFESLIIKSLMCRRIEITTK